MCLQRQIGACPYCRNVEPEQSILASLSRACRFESLGLLKRLVFVRQRTRREGGVQRGDIESLWGIHYKLLAKGWCAHFQGKFLCVLIENFGWWPESQTEIPEGVGISDQPEWRDLVQLPGLLVKKPEIPTGERHHTTLWIRLRTNQRSFQRIKPSLAWSEPATSNLIANTNNLNS